MHQALNKLKITGAGEEGEEAEDVTLPPGGRRAMYTVSWPLWLVVALFAVSLAYAQTNEIITYPVQVHQMVQHHITKVQAGSWTAWSEWSACTRQCGTGITVQTRECRAKPQGRHRRRSHATTVRNHCIGLYKRIHICNTQMCPGNKDARQEQCERYNGQLFLGRAYTWEPFLDAPNQCALNCRARGFRFYATLNNSVEDGTSCRGLITQPSATQWVCVSGMCQHVGCDGVVGSDKRLDTCGVCGGDNSTCRVISGLFTRPQLPVGYNLITQIPHSACNLTISELKQSRNYLALRRHDGTFVLNGNWAINWSGDYEAVGTKFTYHREDDHSTESIYSPGPLQEPLDLMVIYQQPNPGIKYQYQLPMLRSESIIYPTKDAVIAPPLMRHSPGTNPVPEDLSSVKDNSIDGAEHNKPLSFPYGNAVLGSETQGYSGDEAVKSRPKRKRKFAWKISGYTECTKACGGGVQTSIILCVREHNQMTVPERRCAALEKPPAQTIRCNVKPCVAEWVPGEWSECSVTCGEGVQTREIICRQEITPTLIMTVAEGACLTPPSPLLHRTRSCQRPQCPGTLGSSSLSSLGHSLHSSALLPGKWEVGAWSQCSVQCGLGVRTRTVTCPTGDCPLNDKPIFQAVCDMGSCSHTQAQSHHGHSHNWFYTEWSNQCSETCGTGVQTRKVHCSAGPDLELQCDAASRPESSRACSSDKLCGGQWFTGPWGQCSASCGWGRHSRTVLCVAKVRGELVITSDSSCLGQDKPVAEQQCRLQPCGSEWYTADWSQCSRSCDTGLQRREVRCLDENQVLSNLCSEESKPPTRRSCNTHRCPSGGGETTGEQSHHQDNQSLPAAQPSQVDSHSSGSHEQAVHTEPVSGNGTECVDKFRNCHLVVQARLCKYKYYRSSCCQACHNKV